MKNLIVMKRMNKIKAIALTGLLMIATGTTFAQMGQGKRGMRPGMGMKNQSGMYQNCQRMIPDLTEEQENKIQKLRTAHMNEMTDFRNQLNEKRARLRTLQTSDNPSMNNINKVIEEMGDIRTEMHKERVSHLQKVRSELTDEQKTYFDNRMMRQGRRHRGMHPGRRSGRDFSDRPYGRR